MSKKELAADLADARQTIARLEKEIDENLAKFDQEKDEFEDSLKKQYKDDFESKDNKIYELETQLQQQYDELIASHSAEVEQLKWDLLQEQGILSFITIYINTK